MSMHVLFVLLNPLNYLVLQLINLLGTQFEFQCDLHNLDECTHVCIILVIGKAIGQ